MPVSRPGRLRSPERRLRALVQAGLAIVLLLGLAQPARAQSEANLLRDGGFESAPLAPGNAWRPVPGDFDAILDRTSPNEGVSSLRLDRRASASSAFAAVGQAIDATPYRGRTIRFRATARVLPEPGAGIAGAGLWLRIDREGGAQGFFDNMSDRPIRSRDWTVHEITGPVAADAVKITVGFLFNGAGSAWIDAASLEIVPDRPAGDRSADPPSDQALRNLEAFARLYGQVRWFSGASTPSDPRWSVIAVEGARDIERADGDEDLARRLQRWFEPMAPGLFVGPPSPRQPLQDVDPRGLSRWRHTGVALENPAYRSERIEATAPEVWRSELVTGVEAHLPVTAMIASVPDGGVLPHYASASAEDRAIRLGGLVIAWNVFRHFYPYFDDEGGAWDLALPGWLSEAAIAPDSAAFVAVLERMTARLEDGHGDVGPRTQAYRLPLVWQPVEGALVITGLPAVAPPGLTVGDVVLAIDGRPVDERLDEEETRVSASTNHRRVWRAAERLLSRERAEAVALEILDADGVRRVVAIRTVPRIQSPVIPGEPRPAPVTWLPRGIWYFDLTRLDDATLTTALAGVQPGQSVIFDLRGYPGGVRPTFLGRLSTSEIRTPPFRIPVDLLPNGRSRTWETVGWSVLPQAPHLDGQIVFLTDARAISYAETVLAMVFGHGLGEIVGSPTAGTNGNVNPFTLPGGYRIAWTGMEVVNHDGTPLDGHGVAPTVPASRTIAGVRAGQDEVLRSAIVLISDQRPSPDQ